jgi:hypothetical protein
VSETYTLCPTCGQRVEPDEPGVHYGRELRRIDTFGGTEYLDGIGGFFHARCALPRNWRAEPIPDQ